MLTPRSRLSARTEGNLSPTRSVPVLICSAIARPSCRYLGVCGGGAWLSMQPSTLTHRSQDSDSVPVQLAPKSEVFIPADESHVFRSLHSITQLLPLLPELPEPPGQRYRYPAAHRA